MRRYGYLWESLTSFENLYLAARKARRGKRHKPAVEAFEFDVEANLVGLRRSLLDRSYRPGAFRTFTIADPKPRLISAAPYPDRVVHHALCNVLEPLFERSFIFDSYACRKGNTPDNRNNNVGFRVASTASRPNNAGQGESCPVHGLGRSAAVQSMAAAPASMACASHRPNDEAARRVW